MSIQLKNIHKSFGSFQALKPLNLQVGEGQMVGLLGPSGSGKTTLLRIIAGLEQADGGQVFFDKEEVTKLHVRDRKVGFVFQHYALFRHMTVADNIAFGLTVLPKKSRPTKAVINSTVAELLERIQLPHLAQRFPEQLSGGQKQRVALVRALAMQPKILLLDEPFGALDAQVRTELRRWLKNLHDDLGFTSIFVTHDQEEALEVSDKLVVMSQGDIEQEAAPSTLYLQPSSRFVHEFLGKVNIFSGKAKGSQLCQGAAWVRWPENKPAQAGQLYLRPHELLLQAQSNNQAHLPLTVTSIDLTGAEVRLELEPVGWGSKEPWQAGISHQLYMSWQPKRGDKCFALPLAARFFKENSDTQPQNLHWLHSANTQMAC